MSRENYRKSQEAYELREDYVDEETGASKKDDKPVVSHSSKYKTFSSGSSYERLKNDY